MRWTVWPTRWARRCGAIRTSKVQRRATLLLLRLRYQIVTTRDGIEQPLLAEDCQVVGFAGTADKPEWLSAGAIDDLVAAEPEANVNADSARDFVAQVVQAYPLLEPRLREIAEARGQKLLDAHQRVHQATRTKNVQTRVEPKLPPDVLGIYVYLPVQDLARHEPAIQSPGCRCTGSLPSHPRGCSQSPSCSVNLSGTAPKPLACSTASISTCRLARCSYGRPHKGDYDLLRQALHILPPFNTGSPYGWFLIDGQQRLSVLYQAFEGSEKENSSGRVVDFGRISFVLYQDAEDENPAYFVYRKPVDRRFVSVSGILAHDWRRRHKGYSQNELSKIQKCRQRLLDYRVPIVIVHSPDLADVREIFLRINSGGLKISAADRAFARAATVDLP